VVEQAVLAAPVAVVGELVLARGAVAAAEDAVVVAVVEECGMRVHPITLQSVAR